MAEFYLGVPYDFGGQRKISLDCSGFIRRLFLEAYGLNLPHNSTSIFDRGKSVSRDALRPGDLVFFNNFGFIDHGCIHMGKNCFIHSATSVGVSYSTLDAPYFVDHYAGARRLKGGVTPGWRA